MSFIILIILSLIFGILAVILFVVAIIQLIIGNNFKNALFTTIGTLFSILFSLVSYFNIRVPQPTIFPLDNEIQTYSGNIKITITSDKNNVLDIYYTLDGTDPIYGESYESSVIIWKSTVVCARTKFLWWWSDITKSAYKFEKISFSNDTQFLEENIDKTTEPETELNLPYTGDPEMEKDWETTTEPEQTVSSSISSTTEPNTSTPTPSPILSLSPTPSPTKESASLVEGINVSEGYNLMTYVNQYRTEAGVEELNWNTYLEQETQNIATIISSGEIIEVASYPYPMARQTNGAKNAQRAVSDWITGTDYIPSEAEALLSTNFTQIGGALYYLPNGNEYGYHYFWVIYLQ